MSLSQVSGQSLGRGQGKDWAGGLRLEPEVWAGKGPGLSLGQGRDWAEA